MDNFRERLVCIQILFFPASSSETLNQFMSDEINHTIDGKCLWNWGLDPDTAFYSIRKRWSWMRSIKDWIRNPGNI